MEKGMRADLAISVVLAALFAFVVIEAGQWGYRTALFPLAIGAAGLVAVVALVFVRIVLKRMPAPPPRHHGMVDTTQDAGAAGGDDRGRALRLLGWIATVVGLSWLLGQMVAMSLFMLTFLRYESGVRWRTAALAATLTGGFLYVVFDRVLVVTWLDGAVYRWIGFVL